MPKLKTDRMEDFCQRYAVHLNGTQAAIEAGYSAKCAAQKAHALRQKPEILDRIAELRAEIAQRAAVDGEWVRRQLKAEAMGVQIPESTTQAARVRALELLGKDVGMWGDDEHGGAGGSVGGELTVKLEIRRQVVRRSVREDDRTS